MLTLSIVQLVLGILVLGSALAVVISKNPVVSAIMLMSTLFLTGGMYLGLGLYFIGAIQILIYAGAIAVLFVFIVMLLDLKPFRLTIPGRKMVGALAVFAALVMFAGFAMSVLPHTSMQQGSGTEAQLDILNSAHPKVISLQFLTKFMIPFQVTGLLILAAVMGAVVLGRPRKAVESANGGVN